MDTGNKQRASAGHCGNSSGPFMKILDLSHTFDSATPVYPGTEPPVITQESTIEYEGSAEKKLVFYSHSGTHIDVPAHMQKNGSALDTLDISHFTGRGYAIDVSRLSYDTIDLGIVTPHKEKITGCDFVIFHSGWYRYSWSDSYLSGFPVLSKEAAEWLAGFSLKGIGVDMISVDPVGSSDYRNHMIFFRKNMVIVENLTNTDTLPGLDFTFHAFPLKIADGDGSPVRAVAVI